MRHWKAVLKGEFTGGDQIRNVFYFTDPTDTGSGFKDGIGDWMDALLTPIMPYTSSNVHYYGIELHQWVGSTWVYDDDLAFSATGTGSGDALPRQTAGVITSKTMRPKSVAKKFFAGMLESANSDGVLSSAVVAALTSAAVEWLTPVFVEGVAGCLAAIWHKETGAFYYLTLAAVNALYGTQRRRKQNVGA